MLSGQDCQPEEAASLAVKRITKIVSNTFNFLGFDRTNLTNLIITINPDELVQRLLVYIDASSSMQEIRAENKHRCIDASLGLQYNRFSEDWVTPGCR